MKKLFMLVLFAITVALGATTIYDIQYTTDAGPNGTYPSPLVDQDVTVTGIVTANRANTTGEIGKFFISQPEGGAWKGIYVFHWNTPVQVGDMVEVTATVTEYYGYTELIYCDVTILSSGNPVPNPIIVTTGQMTGGMTAESYEGCLVKVMNVTVTEATDQYGVFMVNDGTGECNIDDLFYVHPEPAVNDTYTSIIGNVNYSFDAFSINPRTLSDVATGTVDPLVTVNGRVVSEQFINGLVANISLTGPQTYSVTSNSQGFFTIPYVIPNSQYSLTITANGYSDYSANFYISSTDFSLGVISLNLIASPPTSVTADFQEDNVIVTWQNSRNKENRRLVDGYKVWRLASGSENNESSWTLLTGTAIQTNSYLDTAWQNLSAGLYRYAVKSIYPGNISSSATFSNELVKGIYGTVEIYVYNENEEALNNASVMLDNNNIAVDDNGYCLINNLAPGIYSVSAVSNNYIAKSQIIEVNEDIVTSLTFYLQEDNALFSDNFEQYFDFSTTLPNWLNVDFDLSSTVELQGYSYTNSTVPKAFMVFTPAMTTPPLTNPEFEPWEGNKYLACFASTSDQNNDWIISPEMTLDNFSQISFSAKSATDQFNLDRFSILASSTSINPENFSTISGPFPIEVPTEWTSFTYSLDAFANQTVRFAIRGVSNNGFMLMIDDLKVLTQHNVDNVHNTVAPLLATLNGNFPNPFNPSTDISFSLPKLFLVDLSIYNIKGQKIKNLLNANLGKGEHTISWDGTNEHGEHSPSGIYFCRLSTNKNAIQTKKMVLLK
ncbi:choice-of-anchor J domain-containing protein [bacterium]|nr:choice-of-anchor J domain-containing protein [bacterium]